ncbi:MAG TPA: class IV adenylate cyclase [Chitinophagaceae bacterium]|nr:class IV adenylate cyclase [Chitinophagaceae bacterium]
MKILNFEFKAIANNLTALEEKLQTLNPVFKGEDHQTDTYFNVNTGRLKLREGNIENALIYYERKDDATAKQSDVLLYKHAPDTSLKEILTKLHGIKVIVEKKRRIYFIDNIKFHFDTVPGLGTFIETEAIDQSGNIGIEKLKAQCDYYFSFFELQQSDCISKSYSDLLLEKQEGLIVQ